MHKINLHLSELGCPVKTYKKACRCEVFQLDIEPNTFYCKKKVVFAHPSLCLSAVFLCNLWVPPGSRRGPATPNNEHYFLFDNSERVVLSSRISTRRAEHHFIATIRFCPFLLPASARPLPPILHQLGLLLRGKVILDAETRSDFLGCLSSHLVCHSHTCRIQ